MRFMDRFQRPEAVLACNPMAAIVDPSTLGLALPVDKEDSNPLGTIRVRMQLFHKPEREILQEYVKNRNPDVYAIQVDKAQAKGISWFTWLTSHETAAEPALRRTLDWHVANMAELQTDAHIAYEAAETRKKAAQVFTAGLRSGRLSPMCEPALKTIGHIEVGLTDPFNPTLRRQGADAYADPQSNRIIFKAEITSADRAVRNRTTAKLIKEIGVHEWAHQVVTSPATRPLHWILKEVGTDIVSVPTERLAAAPHGMALLSKPLCYPNLALAIARGHRGPRSRVGRYVVDESMLSRAYSGTAEDWQQYSDQLDNVWNQENVLGQICASADDAIYATGQTRRELGTLKTEAVAGKAIIKLFDGWSKKTAPSPERPF